MLVIVYVREPVQLSVFPTVLLIATLYRLALNVASTRLILLEADAGKVIASFGNFVVGGNYFVGAVVFLILVIVNFVVITKGSGRIAEVAARFTLDAMPGKQMAIIEEEEDSQAHEAFHTDEEPENSESQKEDMKTYLQKLHKRMTRLNEALNESEKLIQKQTNERAIREQVQMQSKLDKDQPIEKVSIADFFNEKIRQWR